MGENVKMKLLLENWREYLAEDEAVEPVFLPALFYAMGIVDPYREDPLRPGTGLNAPAGPTRAAFSNFFKSIKSANGSIQVQRVSRRGESAQPWRDLEWPRTSHLNPLRTRIRGTNIGAGELIQPLDVYKKAGGNDMDYEEYRTRVLSNVREMLLHTHQGFYQENQLFENWREYLKLESFEGGVDPDQAKSIEETGLILNRYLGEGKHGKVYEVEDKKTGQRMAAKVISTLNSQIYSETKNYNRIIKNRDKLPDDVKEHLVEVYELIETPDRRYLIILMEQLSAAPRDVIDQIFAHDKESKYSEEKEDRIFKDPEATYEIVNEVLKLNNMLKNMRNYRGFSNSDRTKAANNILGVFLSEQEVPESSIKNVYDMLETYEISSPQWQRLFNITLKEVEKLLQAEILDRGAVSFGEPAADAILWAAASAIDKDLHYNIKKQIIPLKYGAGTFSPQRGAPPEIASVFPEIEGILKTIKYFAEHGWRARDLHAGNVMTRADTNQLVIVDVGLFVVERDFR